MTDEPLYPEHPDLADAYRHLHKGLREEARARRAERCAEIGHDPGLTLRAWGRADIFTYCARCGDPIPPEDR